MAFFLLLLEVDEKLDPAKALGSDQVLTIVFKLCGAKLISSTLKVIYCQLLEHDTLTQDWSSANITPVFKRSSQHIPANY